MTTQKDIDALHQSLNEIEKDVQKTAGDAALASLVNMRALLAGLQPSTLLTPEQVNSMAEEHGIDGDERHWYVVGLMDREATL